MKTRTRNGHFVNKIIKLISQQKSYVQIKINNFNELKFYRIDVLAGRYISSGYIVATLK